MITQLRLQNFKGHRDTQLALQQLTMLVGDNGSGKTSVLEALQLPGQILADFEHVQLAELLRDGTTQMSLRLDGHSLGQAWTAALGVDALEAAVTPGPAGPEWILSVSGTDASGEFDHRERHTTGLRIDHQFAQTLGRLSRLTGPVSLYRFQSAAIAAAAYSDRAGAPVGEDGAQTAVALAGLKLADDEAFERIEAAMCRIIPTLRRIRILPIELLHPSNPNPVVGSKLYFDFQGARSVPAHHASHGTLVLLALLTVLHGRGRPNVILLDGFDHSLHPRAQMEVVRMLKDLLALEDFANTQIIATTHSPYVLDEVTPANVIAFALRDDGTVASKPLSEHPDAPKVNGALRAGELWSLDAERDWVR
ncbi:MAG TPA: AAA family ATPase [Kofleriaceae bacterium]|nr:AAA family ATPase [Kofleriaceae bacterium]